MMILPPQTPL